jgi:dATP pyrophosphohydrolase
LSSRTPYPHNAFQVLVFPYRLRRGELQIALFRRADNGHWQGIAGGGENDESPAQAAIRETREESGLAGNFDLQPLGTVSHVPAACFKDRHLWANDIDVVPEYSFAVAANEQKITLSVEHTEFEWLGIDGAIAKVEYDSNRAALRELGARLRPKSANA